MTWTPADLLPGLWLILLASILAGALRRWFDPVPARCWIVFAAVLLALFASVLFGGRVLLPVGYLAQLPPFRPLWPGEPPGNLLQSDLVLQIAPWLARVRAAYAAGEWPLWNHLVGAGEPLLGNPQSQALQPLALLGLVLPVAQAAGIVAAARVLAALVFAFLLFRRQGLSEVPALAASLAYALGGCLQLWLGWPLANSAALLPLLLYALVRVVECGARRDRALLVAAVAAVLLAGHPETVLHALAVAALFAAARLRTTPPGARLRLAAAWLGAAAIGAALAAPALLPAADYLPQTLRARLLAERHAATLAAGPLAGWRTPAERAASVAAAARRLVPIVAAPAYGSNRFGRYWGPSNMNEDAAGFVGTAALLGVALALLPARRRLPQERLALGLAVVALVVLARPPGWIDLVERLPLLRGSWSYHSRVGMVFNLAAAYAAGCAWERARRGELPRRAILPAAVALGGLMVGLYMAHPDPEDPARLLVFRGAMLGVQLAALAVATAALRRSPSRSAWIAAAVAIELLAIHGPVNPGLPARLAYPTTDTIQFVGRRLDPWYRMAGVGGALRPNVGSVYGLADVQSSNPAKPAAVADAIERINHFPDRATDGFVAFEDPLHGLLGLRLVIASPRRSLPPLEPVRRRPEAWVYRRRGALPRLSLPAAAARCPERPSFSWSACTSPVRDFAQLAMLPPGSPPARWSAAAPAGSRLELLALATDRLTARALLLEPRLLASSVFQDGGWTLLVDGRPRSTSIANGPFVSAWLPAGAARLDLLYRPAGFLRGLLAAALGVAAALAILVPAPPRPRPP
jgi:hypothetical protein